MRKLQNIISTFGTRLVRQGNQLVVRIESLRSLRARSQSRSALSALLSSASEPARWLREDAWQGSYHAWSPSHCDTARVGTATCFATAIAACFKQAAVVKQQQRRHLIMCHRTAA